MTAVDVLIEEWLDQEIKEETNPRRIELLQKGLGHGTLEFLRTIWHPVVGNLDHLHPEWEIRDFNNRYRYLDLAYMPGGVRGCIEIHGYRSHARDIEAWRFKDLCMKQSLLSLDDWLFLPLAYLSIVEDPSLCKQLVLSLIGKFVSQSASQPVSWMAAEIVRYARRVLRPFEMDEICAHLQRSERQTRRVLEELIAKRLIVTNGKQRYRTFQLADARIAIAASSANIKLLLTQK